LLDRDVKKNIIKGLDEWTELDAKMVKLRKMFKTIEEE